MNGTKESGPHSLAVLFDFENLAMGFPAGRKGAFNVHRVLDRLLEKGKVVVKIAYADWSRFRKYETDLHEAGIELIEIPKRKMTGKNSADIRLVVDAMDLCYSKDHIDTFVIVSGDSDFSPLVNKLKENGKSVIGLGMRESTSKLLADNCDEFLYYEDVVSERGDIKTDVRSDKIPDDKREAYSLLIETIRALQREGGGLLLASRIKDTMKRKRPAFSEGAYGFRSFSDLLEAAEDAGLLELKLDEPSGTLVVSRLKSSGPRRRRKKT